MSSVGPAPPSRIAARQLTARKKIDAIRADESYRITVAITDLAGGQDFWRTSLARSAKTVTTRDNDDNLIVSQLHLAFIAFVVFGALDLLRVGKPSWVVMTVDTLVLVLALVVARRSYRASRLAAESYTGRRS